MTKAPVPDSVSTSVSDLVSVADEFAHLDALNMASEEDESEDDEDGENGDKGGSKGNKKKGSLKDYEVVLDRALLDYAAKDDLSPLAALLDIIRRLKLASPSNIIRGTSGFGPEHPDLTLRELGLLTKRLSLHNIADPHLLKKLDAAQRELRLRENIAHPDDWLQTGDTGKAGVAEAIIGLILGSDKGEKDKSHDKAAKRREQKNKENRTIKEDDFDGVDSNDDDYGAAAAEYTSNARNTDELMSPKATIDMSDILALFDDDLQFDHSDHEFDMSVVEPALLDRLANINVAASPEIADNRTYVLPTYSIESFDTMTELFNVVTNVTEIPVDRVALSRELHFTEPEYLLPSQQLDI